MKTNGAKAKQAYRWIARVYAVEQCDGAANRVFQLRFSVICRRSSSPLGGLVSGWGSTSGLLVRTIKRNCF